MTKNKAPPSDAKPEPQLTESPDEAGARIDARIALGTEIIAKAPDVRTVWNFDDVELIARDLSKWHDYNLALLRRMFTGDAIATEYDWSAPAYFAGRVTPAAEYQKILDGARKRIERLQSIRETLELYPAPASAIVPPKVSSRNDSDRVFVVHGHDEAPREILARFLEVLDLKPVILHEQANAGLTLIQKFQSHANAPFAVVLFTPDDVGASKKMFETAADKASAVQARVRQNVLIELGYFIGKLGLDRVCVLHVGQIEMPSDFLGVVYVPMDSHGGWKSQLARELKQAGFSVDMNKAL